MGRVCRDLDEREQGDPRIEKEARSYALSHRIVLKRRLRSGVIACTSLRIERINSHPAVSSS